MKKRFLFLLAVLIVAVTLVAVLISSFATRGNVERLVLERANSRLSIIIWGFGATATDIDIYSYVDFDREVLSITKANSSIFQYGTARLDLDAPSIRKIERTSGAYNFTLYYNSDAEVAQYLSPLRLAVAVTAIVYALLFAVVGWVFVGMVSDPIADLAASMVKITSRNLSVRIAVPRRKDEISQLVMTFNAMVDEIAGTYDRQARFVESMTHDIVTPVQILEGYRQLIERHGRTPELVDEYLEVSKVQLGRLKDMASSLKGALAQERRRRVELADASAITARNLAYYRDLFPSLVFEGEIAQGIDLSIGSADLERIENILIDNAVKYGSGGGRIEIVLRPDEFVVRDFGAGIPAEDRQAIFERHFRGRDAQAICEGSGIGLAILKDFSEEYGFKIGLESQPGRGSTFTLDFSHLASL
jgi:two-component system sensor histidine kinase MprB